MILWEKLAGQPRRHPELWISGRLRKTHSEPFGSECVFLFVWLYLRGEQTGILAEYVAEIRIVGETALEGGLLNAEPSAFQKAAGVIAADGVEIVDHGIAGDTLEFTQKVEFAQAGAGGNVINGELL